jgi:hypothetical protein
VVDFYRPHHPGRGGQQAGEAAQPGTDFQHFFSTSQFSAFYYPAQRVMVDQKILAQTFTRVKMMAFQQ